MNDNKSTNIIWHDGKVTRDRRSQLMKQKGATLWFTGLSASGKSTIAVEVEEALLEREKVAYRLDGDNIRHGLNRNLGFSADDRHENIRRIGEVSKLFADAGVISLCSFISPYQADRDEVRKIHQEHQIPFIEIFVDCSLDVLEERDPKGLYKKARAGEIKGFTGIDAPYEAPISMELHLRTDQLSLKEECQVVIDYLLENNHL
ncbi:adenylyl-sulfate kinase [Gammaproteobacteria bacterium 42_54_T18]|nr:adenylyl-sulfate kinase [Gammaproteobacteria bacterium 42_54_T18]